MVMLGRVGINMINYKPFKSIEEIKSKGEFIKKGKIYPSRIIKSSRRKFQHCITSHSNQWAFPTRAGYLIFVENNDGEFEAAIRIKSCLNVNFKGSPYSKFGTRWQSNHGLSEIDFLSIFNRSYLSMDGVKDDQINS